MYGCSFWLPQARLHQNSSHWWCHRISPQLACLYCSLWLHASTPSSPACSAAEWVCKEGQWLMPLSGKALHLWPLWKGWRPSRRCQSDHLGSFFALKLQELNIGEFLQQSNEFRFLGRLRDEQKVQSPQFLVDSRGSREGFLALNHDARHLPYCEGTQWHQAFS